MDFCIVEDGIIANMIVCEEGDADQFGALPSYDGAAIGEAYAPPVSPEPKPSIEAQYATAIQLFVSQSTSIPDQTALKMPDLFPVWADVLAAGDKLAEGTILRDGDVLYRVVQSGGVVPQEGQPPHGEGMLAVYRPIEVSHAGTEDDPIPWVYGMDCKAGQYFSYEGHIYKVAEGGDMVPCIWAPDTPGLWQWELVK